MCGLSELVAYVEAGAHLDKLVGRDNAVTVAVGAGVPVAYHLSDVGVNEPQVFHQADERFALGFRPGVGGTAFLVQPAHVADTYASAVPARAMRSVEGDIPSPVRWFRRAGLRNDSRWNGNRAHGASGRCRRL